MLIVLVSLVLAQLPGTGPVAVTTLKSLGGASADDVAGLGAQLSAALGRSACGVPVVADAELNNRLGPAARDALAACPTDACVAPLVAPSGAQRVVTGGVARTATGFVISVHLVRVPDGAVLAADTRAVETDDPARRAATFDAVATALLGSCGQGGPAALPWQQGGTAPGSAVAPPVTSTAPTSPRPPEMPPESSPRPPLDEPTHAEAGPPRAPFLALGGLGAAAGLVMLAGAFVAAQTAGAGFFVLVTQYLVTLVASHPPSWSRAASQYGGGMLLAGLIGAVVLAGAGGIVLGLGLNGLFFNPSDGEWPGNLLTAGKILRLGAGALGGAAAFFVAGLPVPVVLVAIEALLFSSNLAARQAILGAITGTPAADWSAENITLAMAVAAAAILLWAGAAAVGAVLAGAGAVGLLGGSLFVE